MWLIEQLQKKKRLIKSNNDKLYGAGMGKEICVVCGSVSQPPGREPVPELEVFLKIQNLQISP